MHELWTAATEHPFLAAVRDGTVADAAFDRWLVQDVHFVADLLAFQSRLLARSPRHAQGVLVSGCAALVAELDWFEEQAARRGLDLGAPRAPVTVAYAGLLDRLDAAPFGAAVTALGVLERVYERAWAFAAPSTERYREFVEHWTDQGFAAYVDALEALATPGHDDLVREVLAQEAAFWDMAMEAR